MNLLGGKSCGGAGGANGGHLAEESRRESSLSVTVMGGLWYGRTFATDNSGLEGEELYHVYVWLSLRMKGEFTTKYLSVTQMLPQRERL